MSKKQDILLIKPPLLVPSVYRKDLKVEKYNRNDNLVSCPDYRTAMPRKITQSECDRRRRIELGIEDEHLARLSKGIVEQESDEDTEYEIAEGDKEKLCRQGNPYHRGSAGDESGRFTTKKSAKSWAVANADGKSDCKWGQRKQNPSQWTKTICGRKRDASGKPIEDTKAKYRCYDGSKVNNESIVSDLVASGVPPSDIPDEDYIVDLVLDKLLSMGVIDMKVNPVINTISNIRPTLHGATQADVNNNPKAKSVYESLVMLTGGSLLQEQSNNIDKCKQYSKDCFSWNSCFTSALRVVALSVASSKGKDFFEGD